jgi:hypothetical protein
MSSSHRNRLVAARLDQIPLAPPRLAGLHHVDETGACACGWRLPA